MLEITVNHQQLTIPNDTEIVLDQVNNAFDLDNISADIVWSFDIPAEPNNLILNNASFIYVSNRKRYECTVDFEGIPISSGSLYIQNATETNITCGVILNQFTENFGKRKLSENVWPDDLVISTSLNTHQDNWIDFLNKSVEESSIVKFFLFLSEEFYKNNDAFGFFKNNESALESSASNRDIKYVNRLFLDENKKAIDLPDTERQGIRVFNKEASREGKNNGYVFTPAIRLDWVLNIVLRNGGMNLSGDFVADNHLKKLFIQSMNALDGGVDQFELSQYTFVEGDVRMNSEEIHVANTLPILHQGVEYTSFSLNNIYGFPNIGFRLLLSSDDLRSEDVIIAQGEWSDDPVNCQLWEHYDEVYFLAIGSADMAFPKYRALRKQTQNTKCFDYGELVDYNTIKNAFKVDINAYEQWDCFLNDNGVAKFEVYDQVVVVPIKDHIYKSVVTNPNNTKYFHLIQLTKSNANNPNWTNPNIGTYTEGVFPYDTMAGIPSDKNLFIQLVKCKVYTCKEAVKFILPNTPNPPHSWWLHLDKYGQLEALRDFQIIDYSSIDYTDSPLNIYSKVLKWSEHVPDITNAEFLTNICKFFGLNLFVNSRTKEAQLSFFKNTLLAKSIDISHCVTSQKKLPYTPSHLECKIDSCAGTTTINPTFKLKDIPTKNVLPLARSYKNKSVFITNENAYNKSIQDQTTKRWNWHRGSGNDHSLNVGDCNEDVKEICPNIKVPNMRWCDQQGRPKFICEIASTGCSRLLDEDYTGNFGFILQQYHGLQPIVLQSVGPITTAMIECANPTIYNDDGSIDEDAISLTATGYKSVGEMYQKPLYDFLAQYEKYSFSLLATTKEFLEIYNLLQPQSQLPEKQTRFIMVDNRKYLPIKITYTFNNSDKVKIIIECARKRSNL